MTAIASHLFKGELRCFFYSQRSLKALPFVALMGVSPNPPDFSDSIDTHIIFIDCFLIIPDFISIKSISYLSMPRTPRFYTIGWLMRAIWILSGQA